MPTKTIIEPIRIKSVEPIRWTTREERQSLLQAAHYNLFLLPADDVLIDDGTIAEQLKAQWPHGVDKVLELIGTTTLKDSLQCVHEGGIVCMTGIVGNQWSFDQFAPMDDIPTAVNLTSYSGASADFMATPLDELAKQIAEGKLHMQVGKTFELDQIVEAHRCMEENRAGGKIVVLT